MEYTIEGVDGVYSGRELMKAGMITSDPSAGQVLDGGETCTDFWSKIYLLHGENNEYKDYENYNDASGKFIDGDCCGNPSNVKIWNRSIYMHESWSKRILNISFGTYQLLVNIILFIFVLWKGRSCIGAGTIVNMAGIGYIADFGVFVLTKCLGQPEMLSMQIRILLMIFAVTMCSFAAAMYMEADMGIAPYDAFGVIIEK